MIEIIKYKHFIFGYIIRYKKKGGVNFLTPAKLNHQVGFLKHKKNHEIIPHLHLINKRKINYTSEVLIIQKGKIRIDLYNSKKKYLFSKIAKKNDIVILIKGAHGFKILNNCEILEIKQGPFNDKEDKIKFAHSKIKKILIK